jgi:hypothetical protein
MLVNHTLAEVNLGSAYSPANALGANPTLSTLVNPIIANVLIISGIAAFLSILFAGFAFITANGDKTKTTQASQALTYGIIGLVVVVAAFLITRIMGAILGFKFL